MRMKARPILLAVYCVVSFSWGAEVEPQPFLAAAQRLIDAAQFLGSPFSSEELATLKSAIDANDAPAVAKAQAVLDMHVLFHVNITPEQRVKVERGAANAVLDESGWRQYLVRVDNEAGVTARLVVNSPQAKEAYVKGSPPVVPNAQPKDPGQPALATRWLDLQMFEAAPMLPTLSGLGVEYRIIQLYSRDAGKRDATFSFDTGQGTPDLGLPAETSVPVATRVLPFSNVTVTMLPTFGSVTTTVKLADSPSVTCSTAGNADEMTGARLPLVLAMATASMKTVLSPADGLGARIVKVCAPVASAMEGVA